MSGGIDICHETVRLWWTRFGPMFANEIRKKRVEAMRQQTHWRWHLDEVYVKINGERRYLWRAVDHEGEVLESFVTKARDKAAALKFIKKAMKRHGRPKAIVTDGLRSYGLSAYRAELGRPKPPLPLDQSRDPQGLLDQQRGSFARAFVQPAARSTGQD